MNDELIDTADLSLSRKSRLPGAGFFYPDSLERERAEQRAREALSGAEAVVVTDSDADGLGCVALVREMRGAALAPDPFEAELAARAGEGGASAGAESPADDGGTLTEARPAAGEGSEANGEPTTADAPGPEPRSSVALLASSPRRLSESLERAAAYAPEGVDVYVCDLCPDRYEYVGAELEALAERASSVRWFDHHQWDEEVAAAVREAGVDLVVGESDEECSTDVALRSLDYAFPERFRELAAVTRDHDLWLKEDPRSDDLADYAYWTEPEAYVAVVGAYGADLPATVEAYIAERRVEKDLLVERAVERADVREVGPWTVGITYGRCSQNEVADALRERGADASVVVKPAGSASIRGSEGFERCHEVAAQVNGGGHPRAAGCKPGIYDDMLDYAHHWTTEGSACKRVILAAFERLAEEATAADDGAESDESAEAPTDDEPSTDEDAVDDEDTVDGDDPVDGE